MTNLHGRCSATRDRFAGPLENLKEKSGVAPWFLILLLDVKDFVGFPSLLPLAHRVGRIYTLMPTITASTGAFVSPIRVSAVAVLLVKPVVLVGVAVHTRDDLEDVLDAAAVRGNLANSSLLVDTQTACRSGFQSCSLVDVGLARHLPGRLVRTACIPKGRANLGAETF
jgi:hypothetical protein